MAECAGQSSNSFHFRNADHTVCVTSNPPAYARDCIKAGGFNLQAGKTAGKLSPAVPFRALYLDKIPAKSLVFKNAESYQLQTIFSGLSDAQTVGAKQLFQGSELKCPRVCVDQFCFEKYYQSAITGKEVKKYKRTYVLTAYGLDATIELSGGLKKPGQPKTEDEKVACGALSFSMEGPLPVGKLLSAAGLPNVLGIHNIELSGISIKREQWKSPSAHRMTTLEATSNMFGGVFFEVL